MLFMMQPYILLATFAAMVDCWLVFNSIVHQDPKVFLYWAVFQKVSPQCVLVHGIISPRGQDFTFPVVELHQIPLCPVPHLAEVNFSQGFVISEFSEGSLYLTV